MLTCTCPSYYKTYLCKHIIGIAIHLKASTKIDIPIQAKNIGSNRKKGRPALAKAALIRQLFRSLIETDDGEMDEVDNENEIDYDLPYDQDYDLVLNTYNQLNRTQISNINYNNSVNCQELDVSLMNDSMYGINQTTSLQ